MEKEPTAQLKSVLMDLIDAVRFAQNAADASSRTESLQVKTERQLEELEALKNSIADSLAAMKWVDSTYRQELSKNITAFVGASIDQVGARMKSKMKKDSEDSKGAVESEKLKAVKSLESFLASSPLPVMDSMITLKHAEGSYAGQAKYKAGGDIHYEFSLNCAGSKFFQNDFTLSAFQREIRLPVRLNKTWLKKEPSAGFERLDAYVLDRAEASRNHLVSTFVSTETESTADIVFSRSDTDSFVTVEYHDPRGRVDVTGEPSLNKFLDLPALKGSLSMLLNAVTDLETSKLALTTLKVGEEDVLESLNCYAFMLKVLEVLKPELAESKEAIRSDNPLLKERLKLLGEKARPIAVALGIPAKVFAEQKWQTDVAE